MREPITKGKFRNSGITLKLITRLKGLIFLVLDIYNLKDSTSMSNSGKPLHYLLRASAGSDAFARNSSPALRSRIGVTDDPYENSTSSSNSKSELTNEVIILKESNNKLLKALVQKERECREFQDHLTVSSKTNADLMDELSDLTLENQRLKLKGIAFLEENRALYNQICQLKKMYSKAISQNSRYWGKSNDHQFGLRTKESGTYEPDESSESWEEISQKLIKQMQEEMMELENLNSKYLPESNSITVSNDHFESISNSRIEVENSNHKDLVPSSIAFSDECEFLCSKSMIHHLKSQVEHLRNQTLNQSTLLKSALDQLRQFVKAYDAARGNSATSTSSKRLSQPSDELFRAYFTKQLHNGAHSQAGGNVPDLAAANENPIYDLIPVKNPLKESQKHRAKELPLEIENRDTTLKAADNNTMDDDDDDDEKVCPICERKFTSQISQTEFENHVFEHLDSKNVLEH